MNGPKAQVVVPLHQWCDGGGGVGGGDGRGEEEEEVRKKGRRKVRKKEVIWRVANWKAWRVAGSAHL